MKYSMEAKEEAARLEEQVHQLNYNLNEEIGRFHFERGERILDAGCGTGVLSRYLRQNFGASVDGIDSSDLRVHQAKEFARQQGVSGVQFFTADLSNIPPQFHGQYDTAVCRYVLEHTSDPKKVIREIKSTLKPGGRLIVIDLDGVMLNLFSENQRYNEYMQELRSKLKFDLEIGRKLPSYLEQCGFASITWTAEILCCQGERMTEEYRNMEQRLTLVGPFLIGLFGSQQRYEEFKALYLTEMVKPANTLVFNKYFCCGKNG